MRTTRIMPKKPHTNKASTFVLRIEKLHSMKMEAIRRRVWFKALTRIDRVLVDLTIRVADRIRSSALAKALLSVVEKLDDAFESRVLRTLKEVGFPLAGKLCSLAQKWGNALATNWIRDLSFARFLAVMHLNNPRTAMQ